MELTAFLEQVEQRFWRSRVAWVKDAALAVLDKYGIGELADVITGLSDSFVHAQISALEIDCSSEVTIVRSIKRYIADAVQIYLCHTDPLIEAADAKRPGFRRHHR